MKNFEKYKTAKERFDEFFSVCGSALSCNSCKLSGSNRHGCSAECAFTWLELEAEEEKPMPCPYCGADCFVTIGCVECSNDECCYTSGNKESNEEAVAAHNRICRAVKAAGEEVAHG